MLQPHTALTDSEEDKRATEMADAIHTHWLYDPVLKAAIPQIYRSRPRRCGGFRSLNRETTRYCVTNRCDFIGLNYYRRETVSAQPPEVATGGEPGVDGLFYFVRNPQSTYTEWGWEIWPQGLTDGIMMIKARYGDIPIYITENGLGAVDPHYRWRNRRRPAIDYLSSHIHGAGKSVGTWRRRARLLPLVLY